MISKINVFLFPYFHINFIFYLISSLILYSIKYIQIFEFYLKLNNNIYFSIFFQNKRKKYNH